MLTKLHPRGFLDVRILPVLVVLAIMACGRSTTVEAPIEFGPLQALVVDKTIHGDTRFTWEERYLVERACVAWWRFSAGRVRFVIVWDYDEDAFVELASAPHLVRASAYLGSSEGGRVEGEEIRLVPEVCPELYPCIVHELGHVAGLGHLAGGATGVMRAHDPSWLFTFADRQECIRVGRCEGPL